MAGFSLDVAAFCQKAKKNPETVMRAVSIKLFSAIIKGSPVDTGRFRMNWQAAGASPASGTIPGTDISGDKASSDAANFVTSTAEWQELTLTNNLPYSEVLEFGGYPGDGPNTIGGYSKQAPAGFVRINIARFNYLLAEEAAKAR